jgi:hypothetical protein
LEWLVLTLAVCSAELDHGCGILGRARLVGAVAHTVAEVHVGAVADNVTVLAAKVGLSDGEHVLDANLLS